MTGLTDIPQEQMEEAMQRSCDEQAEVMAGTDMTLKEAVEIVEPYVPKSDFREVGDNNVTKNGQDKNVLRKEKYEKRRNKTPEEEKKFVDEAVKLITEQYGDVLRRLADS